MTWDYLIWFGGAAALLWIAGALAGACTSRVKTAIVISLAGSAVFFAFIAGLWAVQQYDGSGLSVHQSV